MEPYDWGVKAALIGMSEDSNPYRPGTDDHSEWLDGFCRLTAVGHFAMTSRSDKPKLRGTDPLSLIQRLIL